MFALSLASLSFLLAVIWGQPLTRLLRYWRMGTMVRAELPGSYQEKVGTPTMGGLTVVVPVLFITIALNVANVLAPGSVPLNGSQGIIGRSIWVPTGVMVGSACLGGLDDYVSVRGTRRDEGVLGRWLFWGQIVLALVTALVLYFRLDYHNVALTGVAQPIDIGLLYIPIATLFIVGMCNAVNFRDGMDGLAGIIIASALTAFAVIAFLQSWTYIARFCFVVVGALLAFLWYNAHPCGVIYGWSGFVLARGHAGPDGAYERPVVGLAHCGHCPSRRDDVRYLPGGLF
jgi:phospho-N-acetylmuramoyl-pentapeptide-transferase